jgi:hypothetical protein
MRRSICIPAIVFALAASAGAAFAQALILHDPVDLRTRPGARRPIVVTAPAGAELLILDGAGKWLPVSYEGRRFYAPAVQLAAAAPSDQPGPDPTCDYGYPYSGSNYFFARPLARLRHSEPLGFLLGYHRFYPC